MGTNWAKLLYNNNVNKQSGWSMLVKTSEYFVDNFAPKELEIKCGYLGMKNGYFKNFELLEDQQTTKRIKSYKDLIKIKYDLLGQYYSELEALEKDHPPKKDKDIK